MLYLVIRDMICAKHTKLLFALIFGCCHVLCCGQSNEQSEHPPITALAIKIYSLSNQDFDHIYYLQSRDSTWKIYWAIRSTGTYAPEDKDTIVVPAHFSNSGKIDTVLSKFLDGKRYIYLTHSRYRSAPFSFINVGTQVFVKSKYKELFFSLDTAAYGREIMPAITTWDTTSLSILGSRPIRYTGVDTILKVQDQLRNAHIFYIYDFAKSPFPPFGKPIGKYYLDAELYIPLYKTILNFPQEDNFIQSIDVEIQEAKELVLDSEPNLQAIYNHVTTKVPTESSNSLWTKHYKRMEWRYGNNWGQ